MKAIEWIDKVKTARHVESDYAAAKVLGISKQTVSQFRTRGTTMDEDTALKVAEVLGERPAAIILDQAAERVKSPDARTALLEQARQLCILCSITAKRIGPGLRPFFTHRFSSVTT